MGRPSIDYLNARRDSRAASGGANHAVIFDAVSERARVAGLDLHTRILDEVESVWSDFRSFCRESANTVAIGDLADGESEIPF
jgi:hypothetical protein